MKKGDRKQDILQSLARMLESDLSERITTARLAKEVGVSEAALYRHFPSKARMYESLLDFCEESIFSSANKIAAMQELSGVEKCGNLAAFVVNFCGHNPGISRVMTAEVLFGETERLKQRVSQLFDRLELQFKQFMKEQQRQAGAVIDPTASARLLSSLVEGRLQQFVRSNFSHKPQDNWSLQWGLICAGIGQGN